jgi:hypothetical protein
MKEQCHTDPRRARNVAQLCPDGPPPTIAIFASARGGPGSAGSRVCGMLERRKTSQAKACSPPMLMGPSSTPARLHPPTQRSLVWRVWKVFEGF